MALPVTMYRWDDPGAPQITEGRPSEYMNVLKKCLVEGYGEKVSLGWSVEEEISDPPYIACKNSVTDGGSGGVVSMSATGNNGGNSVKIESCQDYVSKSQQGRKSAYGYFDRLSTGTRLLKNWIVIGTGRAFYYFVFSDYHMTRNLQGTTECISYFSGDFNSLYPNDPAEFVTIFGVMDQNNASWNYTFIYILNEKDTTEMLRIYPLDGSNIPNEGSLSSVMGNKNYVQSSSFNGIPTISLLAPVYLTMGTNVLVSSAPFSETPSPLFRGVVPGLYIADSAGYREDPMPVIRNLDNKDYYLIPSGNSYTGCCWINLQEW